MFIVRIRFKHQNIFFVVTSKLWKMESKEVVEETIVPKEAVKVNSEAKKEKFKKVESCSLISSNADVTTLKQFIGKFLNQMEFLMIPGDDEEQNEFHLKLRLSRLQLKKLSLYVVGNGDIHDVEEILTLMIKDVSSHDLFMKNLPMTFYEKHSKYFLLAIPMFIFLFIYLSLKCMKLSTTMLIKWIILQIFLVSVVWNWYFLYQENLTKYQSAIEKGPPKECHHNYSTGFFESLKSSLSQIFESKIDECEEYHQLVSIAPALRVPPTEAISICIVNTLLKPLGSIGLNLGLFFQKLSQQIPFHLQIIAIVFVLIISLFLIIIFNNYSIGGIFFSLSPTSPSRTPDNEKQILEKLDNIIKIVDKIPNSGEMNEIRQILLKNIKEDFKIKEKLEAIKEGHSVCNDGSGDHA